MKVKQRLLASHMIRSLLNVKSYVIVVEHLSVLDHLSIRLHMRALRTVRHVCVVTLPYSVREGINIFLRSHPNRESSVPRRTFDFPYIGGYERIPGRQSPRVCLS